MHTCKNWETEKTDNSFFHLTTFSRCSWMGTTHQEKKALNEKEIKKVAGVKNDRSGKVKEKSRQFLRAGHPTPDRISSHCRSRGYLQAHQLSWPCLLPRVYFPGSLFPGPEQAVGLPGPWFSAGGYSSSGGTGAASPYSQDTSGKHKPHLQRHFALGWENLSSSSIIVQEMTMNKWLPATCYFVRSLPPCKPAASWPGEWKPPDSCRFAPNIAISSLH